MSTLETQSSDSSAGTSWQERMLTRILKNIEFGSIKIATPRKKILEFRGLKDGPSADIQLKNWRVLIRTIWGGHTYFFESFRRGEWETSDLYALLLFGELNETSVDKVMKSTTWRRLIEQVLHKLNQNSLKGSKRNIAAHYDLGNNFYQLWLDKSMTYSAALFEEGTTCLLEAQRQKYLRIANKIELKNGDIYRGYLEEAQDTMNLTIKNCKKTDRDGKERTAVCCLSSLNIEKYDEWKNDKNFIKDVMRFLDNVLSDFIKNAPEEFSDAVYSATKERSVGLGVMGLHSYFQKKMIPLESVMSKVWNKKIFENIQNKVDKSSKDLAEERGSCPDAEEYGFKERFSNKTAIAPTASISIICGGTSPGVEPIAANSYTHKTLSGSFNVRNKYLKKLLEKYGKDNDEVWSSITTNQGSVSHLEFLTKEEKDVFKTAFELDQRWLVDLSADRTPHISQAQSINLFLPADVHKKDLHQIHYQAWKKGLKSLYYCRSKSIQRAENVNDANSTDITANVYKSKNQQQSEENKYEECLSCQ